MAETGKDLQTARTLLRNGELVAVPTETVYGLAGNALNAPSVARIFEVKNRPSFDPLIVHIADYGQINQYVTHVPNDAEQLAKKFWPGPLTLLLKKKDIIPDLVTSGLRTVGIRCPDHPLTQSLLKSIEFPLAAPSANPFGFVSPTTAAHVTEQLGSRIKYVLDGGPCTVGVESTIVGFDQGKTIVHRLGGVSVERLEEIVGPVEVQTNSSSNPTAPGQLKSHYSPAKKLFIADLDKAVTMIDMEKVGILSFEKNYGGLHQVVLSPGGNLNEAARNLFGALRELDKKPVDLIMAELLPEDGLGRAINDRLRRAAAK